MVRPLFHVDSVHDGAISISIADREEISDWMAVSSSGPKAIRYDDQYDSVVFSNFDDDGRDELVTMSDSDRVLPSQMDVRERYDD